MPDLSAAVEMRLSPFIIGSDYPQAIAPASLFISNVTTLMHLFRIGDNGCSVLSIISCQRVFSFSLIAVCIFPINISSGQVTKRLQAMEGLKKVKLMLTPSFYRNSINLMGFAARLTEIATRLTEMVTWRPPIFVPVLAAYVKHFVEGPGRSRKSFKE